MTRLKKINSFAIALLILTLAFACALAFSTIKTSDIAFAYNDSGLGAVTNRVSQIFVNDKSVFDRKVLDELATYAGYTDLSAMVAGVTGGDVKNATHFGSTTVKVGTYTVLGEKDLEWIPAYLSKNSAGHAVLTLYLATTASSNSDATSFQEVSYWSDGTYKYWFVGQAAPSGGGNPYQTFNGSRVYSHTYDGSYIRNAILHQGDKYSYTKSWGYYWNGSTAKPYTGTRATIPVTRTKFVQLTNGNLTPFLTTPSTMSWQVSQSARNDIGYAGSDSVYYPTNWRNDKIWLPSAYECKAGGLWGLSTDQISNNTLTFTRTGESAYSSQVSVFQSNGASLGAAVSNEYGVRPAIHLDLTEVNNNAYYFYKNPEDVNDPVYNYNPQTVTTLSTTPNWWNTDFADTTKFTITYQTKAGADTTVMKNAGEYWVKIEPKSDYKAMFDGAPVTSDSQHLETNSLRWFKFVINKKPLKVKLVAGTDGTYTASEFDASDIEKSEIKPTFGVRYVSSDGKGYTVEPNDNPNKPTKVGTYTAEAVITNEKDGNFEVDKTAGTHTATYVKKPDRLKKPAVINYSVVNVYNKQDYDYGISDEFDPNTMDIIYPAQNVTYDATNKKISIRHAGTYNIEFKLKDPTETCWDETGDPIANLPYPITIDKATISVPSFDANMLASSDVKGTSNTKVPAGAIVDVISGDTYPDIKIMFKSDSAPQEFNFYPTTPGNYTARLEIDNASASNYKLDTATETKVVSFTVTGEVTFEESDLVWIATPAGGGTPIEIKAPYNKPYSLPFALGGYTISVKETTAGNQTLNKKGVKIYSDGAGDNGYSGDIQKTDVGSYSATVRLVNYNSSFDAYDKNFVFSYKIDPRSITKPAYSDGDITFSSKPTDFATLYGLPTDWQDYLEIAVEKNGNPVSGHQFSDAGTYYITFKFKSDMSTTGNAVWDDGTPSFPVQSTVSITPRTVEITGWSSALPPVATTQGADDGGYIEYVFTKTDGTVVSIADVMNSTNTTFKVQAKSKFGDNIVLITSATIPDNQTFSTPGSPATQPTTVPKTTVLESEKSYTGAPLTFDLVNFDGTYLAVDGNLTVTEIGQYSVTVRFRDGVNYCWDDNTRNPITLTFSVTEPTAPPEPPAPKEPGIGEKIKAFFNGLIEKHFPLWQVLTIAVGGLLSVIFLIKSIQYGNRKKKAKGELKKYAPAKAMATLLPIFSTEVVAGLSNQIWSIIAFSVVGVTALMFIVAIALRSGWKKTEQAKEQAIAERGMPQQGYPAQNSNADTVALIAEMRREMQENFTKSVQGANTESSSIIEEMRREMENQRRAEEERRRQDEERHRQEMEAMKMMLANMMGRGQGMDNGDMGYASMDNTDLLVQKVIAGLLPMVQQMIPEPTAYLSAPMDMQNDRYDTLTSVLQQQNEQIANLQSQIADMSRNVLEAEIVPDHSEEIRNLDEKHSAEIEELKSQIESVLQGRVEGELLPDQTEEIRALNAKIEELQQQIADGNVTVVSSDQSDELRAMAEAHNAEIAELKNQIAMMSSMSVDELDDEDFDDEEEWDSILDEDDDDFVEAVIIDDNGNVRKTYPNFRMRLKQSSDKNREWYAVIKNMFCSQKGVTYRVYKRVEKIRYQGQVVGVIGIAKRSIKLWLALKPYEYDARRYHHKDVSDKPRFVDVPMYVRITSDRALLRAEELILALFQELNMEARKRYNDRSIQELIFTLKHNRLLTNKQYKSLLCETMHVHDCDVLDDETAEKCIENKHVDSIDDSYIATIKLDDIDLNFQDGNRVTLERLKKVGLVPEDCTGFTVTAGQRLTKPLIIVANDFTLDAVKLITLTGGRAIRLTLI